MDRAWIDPIVEFNKARICYVRGEKEKAFRLFTLSYEHANEKNLNLRIETCLWISMYFIFSANIEFRVEDVEILTKEGIRWLKRANHYYSELEKRGCPDANRTYFYFLGLQRYKEAITVLKSATDLLFLYSKIEINK